VEDLIENHTPGKSYQSQNREHGRRRKSDSLDADDTMDGSFVAFSYNHPLFSLLVMKSKAWP
jgi:hypothetical protein